MPNVTGVIDNGDGTFAVYVDGVIQSTETTEEAAHTAIESFGVYRADIQTP